MALNPFLVSELLDLAVFTRRSNNNDFKINNKMKIYETLLGTRLGGGARQKVGLISGYTHH